MMIDDDFAWQARNQARCFVGLSVEKRSNPTRILTLHVLVQPSRQLMRSDRSCCGMVRLLIWLDPGKESFRMLLWWR